MPDIDKAARIKLLTAWAEERFDADDWVILESELSHGEIIRQHDRLYKSLAFGDGDYLFNAAEVITSLVEADAENLVAMEEYIARAYKAFETAPFEDDAEEDHPALVFISHKAEEKSFASSLKDALLPYGIDAFVAHEDIHVTAEWEREIERMLRHCDAFVYLSSQMANASAWCQQEIGWAFGRNIPMMSIALNADPIGFLGMRQALRCGQLFQADHVAKSVFEILVRDDRVSSIVVDGLISKLEGSTYFDESNRVADSLNRAPCLTPRQAARIEAAILANDQVSGASHGSLPNTLRQMISEKTVEGA